MANTMGDSFNMTGVNFNTNTNTDFSPATINSVDYNLKKDLYTSKYNYNKPGMMEMAYRVPGNMIGKTLRKASKMT